MGLSGGAWKHLSFDRKPEKLRLPHAHYKVKILVYEKFSKLISTSSFLILKKPPNKPHFSWKKNPVKKFDIPIKHVIFCWYQNNHGCRQNRLCMHVHVMLLQMLQYRCKIMVLIGWLLTHILFFKARSKGKQGLRAVEAGCHPAPRLFMLPTPTKWGQDIWYPPTATDHFSM